MSSSVWLRRPSQRCGAAPNAEAEITVKIWDEYEALIKVGDYDVVRRGIVMQTTDELTNLRMLFERDA